MAGIDRPPVTGVFAEHLRDRRQEYNDRFTAMRMAAPSLSGEAVLAHLAETVAPIVDAVAAAVPEKAGAVCDALYGVSLELLARDLVGPRCRIAIVDDAWRVLLGGLPQVTAEAANPFARTVTNAVHAVEGHPSADATVWITRLSEVQHLIDDLESFWKCGIVAAWQAGMAQYRDAALDAAAALSEATVAALMDIPQPAVASIITALRRDPWAEPQAPAARAPRCVAAIGGFRGFGGPFLTPPLAVTHGRRLVVFDAERAWELIADRFGSTLLPVPLDDYDIDVPGDRPTIDQKGHVRFGRARSHLPDLAGASSQASDGTTLAVTLPLSHFVHLVAVA